MSVSSIPYLIFKALLYSQKVHYLKSGTVLSEVSKGFDWVVDPPVTVTPEKKSVSSCMKPF